MGSTGFAGAVSLALRNYTNVRGLATRAQYWWFVLFQVLGSLVFNVLHLGPVNVLWTLALVVPSITCGVRRHHDAGRSGWWLLTSIVPIWGLVLLLYPSKLVNNRFRTGRARSTTRSPRPSPPAQAAARCPCPVRPTARAVAPR